MLVTWALFSSGVTAAVGSPENDRLSLLFLAVGKESKGNIHWRYCGNPRGRRAGTHTTEAIHCALSMGLDQAVLEPPQSSHQPCAASALLLFPLNRKKLRLRGAK